MSERPTDPPESTTPVCSRCGRKSILGYIRLLDTEAGAEHRRSGSLSIFAFEDLESYGGAAVYLGFYKNYNSAPGLRYGSWDLFACGKCWRELLSQTRAADEAAEAKARQLRAEDRKKLAETRKRDLSPTQRAPK